VIAIVAIAAFLLIPTETEETTQTNDEPPLPTNAPPVAKEDYSVISLNAGEILIDVLSNDVDADGDSINITTVSTPTYGSVKIVENKLYYTPETDYNGAEKIQYTIEDGNGNSVSSSISLIVGYSNPIAVFDTSLGIFGIELHEDKLPITCGNFITLVNDGFYDGMTFYRISDDFMIQAGRYFPDGSQKQSPYNNIEFETHDDVKHVDGAISMASTGAGVGGSGEFFICDGAQSFLDGNYAPFGVVVEGIEIVREIAAKPHDNSNPAGGGVPLENIIINNIKIENN